MTDQVTQSDSAITPAPHADMSKLANDLLDQGIKDATANAAPTSGLDKFGVITGKAAEDFIPGIGHALADDWNHLGRTAEMVGTSAAMGVAVKALLPETGWAGKAVGAGMLLYFGGKSLVPIVEAYSQGMKGTTKAD